MQESKCLLMSWLFYAYASFMLGILSCVTSALTTPSAHDLLSKGIGLGILYYCIYVVRNHLSELESLHVSRIQDGKASSKFFKV